MSDLVVEILILFFEVLCSKIFCEIFGKVRNKGWINIVQLFVLEISVFIMARTFSNVMILKQIVVASIYAGVMLWHVKISIGKSFALGLLYQAMLLSTDYLAYSINKEICSGFWPGVGKFYAHITLFPSPQYRWLNRIPQYSFQSFQKHLQTPAWSGQLFQHF